MAIMRKILMFLVIPLGTAAALLGAVYFLEGAAARWATMAVPLALVIALGLRHGFTLPEDYLKGWTKAHGITITESNGPIIRRYLLRGRRIRTVGALAGYIAYSIWTVVSTGELPFGWITATFAGYLLGAAAAEVWAARPERGSVRTAALTPRLITDYVPRSAVVLMRAVPIATITLAVCYPLIPTRPELGGLSGIDRRPDPLPIVAWTATSVVLWLLCEWTARRIVARPQPVTSEEIVIVDDAIRSTALHGLIGAGLALMLGALARNLSDWSGLIGPGRLDGLFAGVSIVAGLGAIFVWLRLAIDQNWVVKRVASPEKVQTA